MKRDILKGKCELCGGDGQLYVGGLFNYLCNPCSRKAEIIIKRYKLYLNNLSLQALARTLDLEDNKDAAIKV